MPRSGAGLSMISEILEKLARGQDLSAEEAEGVMEKIMAGELLDSQVAAYLMALRCKGETDAEILGSCRAIRRHSVRISVDREPLVDTCGTGGDMKGSFNISTVSALVAAGAGVTVAKHGNRAVSGRCGSADLLEALGVNVELAPGDLERCLNNFGLGFLYAPLMHPAVARAVPARKALGIRTIFNILGPLNNPATAGRQVLGVYEEKLTDIMAAVLASLGSEHSLVVCGEDGLDEISITARTKITELQNGKLSTTYISPEDYGFSRASPETLLLDGDADAGARICLGILQGERGPRRDVVLLNAAAAIYVSDLAGSIEEGVAMAGSSIDSGAAYSKLQSLVLYSRKVAVYAQGNSGE